MSKKHDVAAGFGARLAALRKAAGYTQVQLAQAIGISQRMVAYYESTEDHPVAKVLRHMSRTLDISTDELLGIVPLRTLPARKTEPKAHKKHKA